MSTLQATNLKNATSGSNNIVLATDGSTTITTLNSTTITGTSVRGVITSGTAVASTSGTAIDFTGIPSWVKRVTLNLNGASLTGTANLLVQVGSGSIVSTGYSSAAWTTNTNNANSTAGLILIAGNSAAYAWSGAVVLTLLASNTWCATGVLSVQSVSAISSAAGVTPGLSGSLDRLRLTTSNGTDAFDAGSINILYEG